MDRICLEFINTRWFITHDLHEDPLRDAKKIRDFLDRLGLELDAGLTISPAQMETLISLRDLLFGTVSALDSPAGIPPASLERINRILSQCPQYLELRQNEEGFSAEWRPSRHDWDYILFALTASFADLLFRHDPARIRRCKNADCEWVFYDESKSATRKWCGNTCGNLMKVRRFRQRQKQDRSI